MFQFLCTRWRTVIYRIHIGTIIFTLRLVFDKNILSILVIIRNSKMSSRSGRKRGTNRAIVDFDSVNDQPQTNNATGSNVNDESNNDFIAGTNITETEVLISNCIRYILLNENLKLLIKQADINKHLGECFNLDRSKMNHLMRMVCLFDYIIFLSFLIKINSFVFR